MSSVYSGIDNGLRYYLGTPTDAFNIMKSLGLGITNDDLDKIVQSVTSPSQNEGESTNLLLESCCASSDEEYCKRYGYDACPDNYEEKCINKGSFLNDTQDLASGVITSWCFKSAPDIGKACASDNECFYSCNLNVDVIDKSCNLKEKEYEKRQAIETYDCITDKPGVCSPAPINYNQCGGVKFEFNGKNLKIIRSLLAC